MSTYNLSLNLENISKQQIKYIIQIFIENDNIEDFRKFCEFISSKPLQLFKCFLYALENEKEIMTEYVLQNYMCQLNEVIELDGTSKDIDKKNCHDNLTNQLIDRMNVDLFRLFFKYGFRFSYGTNPFKDCSHKVNSSKFVNNRQCLITSDICIEIMNLFIENDYDINQNDSEALCICSESELIKYYISQNTYTKVNLSQCLIYQSKLFSALLRKNNIRLLLELGADPNACNGKALVNLCNICDINTTIYMIKAGADPTMNSDAVLREINAGRWGIRCNDTDQESILEFLELCEKRGCDLRTNGINILKVAINRRYCHVLRWLLERGVKLTNVDYTECINKSKKSLTAFELLKEYGWNEEIVLNLLDKMLV